MKIVGDRVRFSREDRRNLSGKRWIFSIPRSIDIQSAGVVALDLMNKVTPSPDCVLSSRMEAYIGGDPEEDFVLLKDRECVALADFLAGLAVPAMIEEINNRLAWEAEGTTAAGELD